MPSPASTKPSCPSLRQTILHLLLARPSSPTLTLSNVSRFLNSASGLDKGLMVIQYPAKIVVALLVALAARLVTLDKRGKAGLGMQVLQRVAVTWAARFKALSSSIGDARTMMRLLGIIPVLASLPSLLSSSLAKTDPTAHIINSLQTLSLLAYYPLENISYLSGKGVFPLPPAREANWSTWSCRFWAAYVVLDVWRLARQWEGMRGQERVLRVSPEKGDMEALRKEKESWAEEVVTNVGYAPLTIHWSLPNGAWTNEMWTGIFGTVACLAGIRSKWRHMSP
ncbi:hypothetical protein NCC49_001389 [Naganishia albida]|nr:hypothetical protein NCC49_001389 [Naganishia albida]